MPTSDDHTKVLADLVLRGHVLTRHIQLDPMKSHHAANELGSRLITHEHKILSPDGRRQWTLDQASLRMTATSGPGG
jgi:hypothetical protein